MLITEMLVKNAELYPTETALIEINLDLQNEHHVIWSEYELIENNPAGEYRREMSWQVFNEKANRFAHLLIKRGIKKGDKIAILMMNSLEWLPVYFGILKAGAIVVPLNYRYSEEEIRYCLNLSDSVGLVFGPEFTSRLQDIYQNMDQVKLLLFCGEDRPCFAESYDRLTGSCPSSEPPQNFTEEDYAAIYFSSGTTGFPKAILHKHKMLTNATLTEQNHHRQTHDDVFLLMPPLYHTGAKMHWFGSLYTASRTILLRGVKPEWILRTVSEEKCSIVWLLVPWAQDILDYLDENNIDVNKDYSFKQWRLMHIGAQPVPPSLIRRWKNYFPEQLYDTNYGLSESGGPGCVHLGVENIDKVGAIGKAGYNWQVKIVDNDGNIVQKGQIGELALKGPGVMVEYYKNQKATKKVLMEDGWLLSGDMAREDADGFIYLVDRKKDVIITGGENLYPVEIESFLRRHPAIRDVAVIGLPEERLGEIAAAVVSLKPDADVSEAELSEFAKGLPRYKRPRRYIFDEVPRNQTGKIEKPLLRKRYGVQYLVEEQTER
ncbi:MAG: class I adenylate-forming enzyme family protein [Eubacteriales bacterium]|nr:class I adenylate-forming enzyme family protein [Eubacteriales bacterium]